MNKMITAVQIYMKYINFRLRRRLACFWWGMYQGFRIGRYEKLEWCQSQLHPTRGKIGYSRKSGQSINICDYISPAFRIQIFDTWKNHIKRKLAKTSCIFVSLALIYFFFMFDQNYVYHYWTLNQDRNNLISSLITTRLAWIDATDIAQEGVYKDSDGNNLSFLNFASGEPNGNAGENCLAIPSVSLSRGGGMSDLGCARIEEYVCAKQGK